MVAKKPTTSTKTSSHGKVKVGGKNSPNKEMIRKNRDEEVLAVAISVMSERGYSATSIQEVADRVGVLKGSLYHYFGSKEELLFRILTESHNESLEIIESISALKLDPLQELCEFLSRHATWYLKNIGRANIYFTETRHLTGDRLVETRLRGRNFERHVKSLVSNAQNQGQISPDLDVPLAVRFLIGTLNNIRSWPSRSGKSYSDSELVEAFIGFIRGALGVSEIAKQGKLKQRNRVSR
jgi:AcrR family transcriptional regulator